jgi:hypothetical protein
VNSEVLDRPPPHDLDAERAVIGSILQDPARLDEVRDVLRPDDFYADAHRRIFGHLLIMGNGGGGTIDATLLLSRLRGSGDIEAVGGADGGAAANIAEAIHAVGNVANAAYFARVVKSKAEQRAVIHTATEVLRDAYNGIDAATLRRRLATAIDRIDAGGAVDFQPMTLAQLMQRDVAVEYLIDNLIVARQPILLAGPVKSLKTSILLDLCFALATGGHFLGYFRVLRSIPVAVLTGESGLPTVKDTLARIGRAANIDPANVTRLVISDRVPHLSNPAHLDAIRRLILDYELELLAIDPAYLALDGTEAANVMIFGQQLRAVSELCQEMGVALSLCHHTRKGAGIDGRPLSLTDAAWAGFAEHARQWLLVNHREPYDLDTGTARLWLAGGGSAGHGGLWAVDVHQGRVSDAGGRVWEVSVSTPDAVTDRRTHEKAAKAAEQLVADREEIVAAAINVGGPETMSGLRNLVSIPHKRFPVAFASLVDDGSLQLVRHAVVRTNGQKYNGWKVRDEQKT